MSVVVAAAPAADTAAETTLAARLQLWSQADGDQITSALQRVVQACADSQGHALRSSSPAVQQQLLTLLLQSSHSSAPVPSAAAAAQHQYKLTLDRLWRIAALALAPDEGSCALLESVIGAHTPAAAAPGSASHSRRNSAVPSGAAGAGSRRGSLSQPIEELAVASIRQQAFVFAFDWMRAHSDRESSAQQQQQTESGAEAASLAPHSVFATPQLSARVRSLFVRGVTDMWSAIRKTAAGALTRTPLVARLTDEELQGMLETLTQLALGQTKMAAGAVPPAIGSQDEAAVSSASRVPWQVQEGAMLGISALLTALRQRQAAQPSRPLPSLQPTRFYPLLAHSQLSVREHTGSVLQSYLQLLPESQSAALRHDLLESLMRKLDCDSASSAAESSPQWLSDYESEGILKVLHAVGLPSRHSYVDVLDRYLAHPASSVRQLVADVLARLALHRRGKQEADPARFDLPSFLAPAWDWVECEAEAAAAAQASHFGDAHTSAVFFAIPPPLSAAPSGMSRRGSAAHALPAPNTGSSPLAAVPPLPAGAVASRPHRSSWQWKEGALMSLELYLRALAPLLSTAQSPEAALSSDTLSALAALFPQVVRAATSWSWELRRMAEQIRTPFLAVWLRFSMHRIAPDVPRMCLAWLHDEHATNTPVVTRHPAMHHSVPLDAAVSTVMALKYTLAHLQRVQQQAAKRAAAHSAGVDGHASESDQGVDRKWNQDVDDLSVHGDVCHELARHLPQLLTRLEQLMLTAQLLTDHATLAMPTLTTSPTLDSLAAVRSASSGHTASTPPLVTWDQFATLASEVIVLAYAVDFGQVAHSSSAVTTSAAGVFPPIVLHVSEQGKLQHFQCVLDRLRMIRCLSVGEDHLPAPSVAAQMPPFPAPSSPSISAAVAGGAHMLPSLAPVSIPSPSPPSIIMAPAKTALLQRARAKRLELWLLTHVGSSLAAFAAAVPGGAHVDLLDLLRDYLVRYHASASSGEIRAALLKSVALGWARMRESHQPLMSHQLHQLQECAFTLLLQLLQEHVSDRSLIVAALIAIVSATPIHTTQLKAMLECLASIVPNECKQIDHVTPHACLCVCCCVLCVAISLLTDWFWWLCVNSRSSDASISLSDPVPPSPTSLLSPTSAAVAAETEAWDDWDEDEGDGGGTGAAADSAAASAHDAYMSARQLVLAVSPLLVLLNTRPFVASTPLAPPIRTAEQAHAQSSLAHLVSAYEAETSSAQPDAARQVQLLQWIQQWAAQVQQHVETQQTTSAVTAASAGPVTVAAPAAGASSAPPSAAAHARISSHHSMPINAPLRDTLLSMRDDEQAKIAWLQQQIEAIDAHTNAA